MNIWYSDCVKLMHEWYVTNVASFTFYFMSLMNKSRLWLLLSQWRSCDSSTYLVVVVACVVHWHKSWALHACASHLAFMVMVLVVVMAYSFFFPILMSSCM